MKLSYKVNITNCFWYEMFDSVRSEPRAVSAYFATPLTRRSLRGTHNSRPFVILLIWTAPLWACLEMYPIYLRVYWQKMADIELWRVPMSAFRACVRSESAGQCPWVIAKRAPQMPGGQGVAGSNPVHPTRKHEVRACALAFFHLKNHPTFP